MTIISSENPPIAAATQPKALAAEAEEARRGWVRLRWLLGGCIVGVLIDFVSTAAQVAGIEYTLVDAPELLLWNLPSVPFLGAIAGLIGLIRTRRPGPWRWRRPQLRTRSLMVAVAYLAFLLTAIISSHRLTMIAMLDYQKAINCDEMVRLYRELSVTSEAELKLRHENAAQIQAGKIPENLYPGQADFLRSLDNDPKVTPAYREIRRGLILKTQSDAAARMELAIAFCRKIVEYQKPLAKKYRRASLRPWLPVELDPPPPD